MLGQSIRIIRQAKGLRASALADSARISVGYLSLIENGEKQPSIAVLDRLSEALDVPSEVLILLASPLSGSLRSTDRGASDLAGAVRRLASAERRLASRLRKPGHARRVSRKTEPK